MRRRRESNFVREMIVELVSKSDYRPEHGRGGFLPPEDSTTETDLVMEVEFGIESESGNSTGNSTTTIDGFPVPVEDSEWDQLVRTFSAKYPMESWERLGHFDESYLRLINRHWLTFDPPSPSTHHFLAALYVLLMIIGLSGNFLVIFMFVR
jgi:hypothetical protein